MTKRVVWLLILFIGFFHAQLVAADMGRASLSMGLAGIGNETALAESRFEYRFHKRFFTIVSPITGVMLFSDGSNYLYAGFNLVDYFGRRLMVSPNFAVGAFQNGSKKNLGGILEFRSGLEVGYQIIDKLMVGVAFHHISNASIYDRNPGTETLSLILTIGSRRHKKVSKDCF